MVLANNPAYCDTAKIRAIRNLWYRPPEREKGK
jgi:hypothetical protein